MALRSKSAAGGCVGLMGWLLVLVVLGCHTPAHGMSKHDVLQLRDEVLEMVDHGLGSYMDHAYPMDELKPLSCTGRRWDRRERGTLDDTMGGYQTTLIDSLSTLAVTRNNQGFQEAVILVLRDVHFDRDVTVSVFESTIRVLGGLLSAHMLMCEFPGSFGVPGYDGGLLSLAQDLGNRLLPAFDTATGLPAHRVNLRHGVLRSEKRETCTAAAGTLLVEFGALSRLTGDDRFEHAARRAVQQLWDRRSKIGLVGSTINIDDGRWLSSHSGIGAGIDSFYEYLLKAYILFGDEDLLDMFETSFEAAQMHTRWGEWNIEVSMQAGRKAPHSHRVSALQAFWPSLQVLAGDLAGAKRSHQAFHELWKHFRSLPEIFDVRSRRVVHFAQDSPLRPEFAESTYHLFAATGDEHYLDVGKDLVFALQNISRVSCGFAAIADVRSHRLDDRMDSFFISETLKYLFLLFDHALEEDDQRALFCAPAISSADVATGASATANESAQRQPQTAVTRPLPTATDAAIDPTPLEPGCLNSLQTIFSTEGHLFILSQLKTQQGDVAPEDCPNPATNGTEGSQNTTNCRCRGPTC